MKFGALTRITEEVIRMQPKRMKNIFDDMMSRLERLSVGIKREDNMKGKMFVLQIQNNVPFVLQSVQPIGVSLMSCSTDGVPYIFPQMGWRKSTNGAEVLIKWSEGVPTANVRIFVEEE